MILWRMHTDHLMLPWVVCDSCGPQLKSRKGSNGSSGGSNGHWEGFSGSCKSYSGHFSGLRPHLVGFSDEVLQVH